MVSSEEISIMEHAKPCSGDTDICVNNDNNKEKKNILQFLIVLCQISAKTNLSFLTEAFQLELKQTSLFPGAWWFTGNVTTINLSRANNLSHSALFQKDNEIELMSVNMIMDLQQKHS